MLGRSAETAIRSTPPSGIARSALVARFQTTCRICAASARQHAGASGTSTATTCDGSRSGLFCSSVAVSVTICLDVHTALGIALRPGVVEEAANRVVQPLRLADHDVHQLRLIVGQRQLLAQDLNRPGHRRQRVADLVRDSGGHLPHRREPLLHARVALLAARIGDVTEREHEAGLAGRGRRIAWREPVEGALSLSKRRLARRRSLSRAQEGTWRPQDRGAQPELDAACRPDRVRSNSRRGSGGPPSCGANNAVRAARPLQHLCNRLPARRGGRHAGNGLGRAVERQDPPVRIGGRQRRSPDCR